MPGTSWAERTCGPRGQVACSARRHGARLPVGAGATRAARGTAIGWHSLDGPLDAELLQLLLQRGPLHPEARRGALGPADDPSRGDQRVHDAVSYTHLTLPTSDLV